MGIYIIEGIQFLDKPLDTLHYIIRLHAEATPEPGRRIRHQDTPSLAIAIDNTWCHIRIRTYVSSTVLIVVSQYNKLYVTEVKTAV